MADESKAVTYGDESLTLPEGYLFYPEEIRIVQPFLQELNRDEILDPESFNANMQWYLDNILLRLRSFHDSHRAALDIHNRYRLRNEQYCLYLRSFTLSGFPLSASFEEGMLRQTLGMSAADRRFQHLLTTALPSHVAALSVINPFDVYSGRTSEASDDEWQTTLPSIRLLSHNWREVVRELVRGACLIVLNSQIVGEGLRFEFQLLSECGMEGRTIVTGTDLDAVGSGLAHQARPHRRGRRAQFGHVIDLGSRGDASDNRAWATVKDTIYAASRDGFRQTNRVGDLSQLPCWVIDRHIEMARSVFSEETLADVPYDQFIPSSSRSNWMLLTELFPKMVDQWRAIETTPEIRRAQLPGSLYLAVSVFHVAVTLERYYEMSMSLSIIGMAHKALTGKDDVMLTCYRHAAWCAQWSGDPELSTFLAGAYDSLLKEAKPRPDPL